MQTKRLRLFSALLCLCLALCLSVPCLAAGRIDPQHKVTLTLTHPDRVSGMRFDLYRVAAVDEFARFTAEADFAAYDLDFDVDDSAQWRQLAETLRSAVLRDGLTPLDSGKTDAAGMLRFPSEQHSVLLPGLYLVIGHPTRSGGYDYIASPFLISLPNLTEDDVWQYDVAAVPKSERTPVPDRPQDETVTRKVLKVWDDAGSEDARPDSITVLLYRDGILYDTVTIREENDWRWRWEELPKYGKNGTLIEWTLAERDVNGYISRISQEGVTFVVRNTLDTPHVPEYPGGDLPMTGALWWPVPVLLMCGILCLLFSGFCGKKKHRS